MSIAGVRRRAARSAVVSGLAVVAVYGALAAWSGAISPLGRGPLLDGLGPTNYRWVSPPPELEATNQEPEAGRFDLPLDRKGVGTQVAFTADSQVSVVIDEGAIGPAPGQRSVALRIDPVDPAQLPPPGGELAVFGNAYELTASYRPSGDPIERLDEPLTVILTYPATSTLHANAHEMLYSADGGSWTPLETTDSPGQQQAEAEVPGMGFVVVAGVPAPPPPTPTGGSSGGTPPLAIALLVGAGVVLLIGVGLLIRSRAG